MTLFGIVSPGGAVYEVRGRRNPNGWSVEEYRNGVLRASKTTTAAASHPVTGPEIIVVTYAVQKVLGNDRVRTYPGLGFGLPFASTESGVVNVDVVTTWMEPNEDFFDDAEGVVTWLGSVNATEATVGRVLGAWYFRAMHNTSVTIDGLMDFLGSGTVDGEVVVPYDPALPEVDPNEVPELAPAVPVPWPEGWPDPDLDDPAPSPSTSTIPDPSPRPSLAPEVPGETTDTALASRIMDGFGWLGDRIGGFFDWLVSELWRMVEWIVDRLRELLFQLIVAMLEIARWIVQELFRIIRWAVEELVKALRRIVEVLIEGLSSIIGFLRMILDELVAGLVALANVIGAWATWLGDVIGQWVTWLSTSLWSMFEWLAATLNGIAVWMLEQLESMTLSVSVAFSVLVDLLEDLFVDIFVPTYTWSEVIPDPGPPPPNPLPPGLDDLSAVCGPSFSIPVVDLTFRTPNPSTSGCPGHGPGGSRLPVDDLQGDVWGYRNALRALMAFSLWLSVGFVGLRAMPWSRSRDDASDSFVNAAGSL